MSYKANLNQIDIELKKLFNSVKINTNNHNAVDIELTSSILENVNNKLEMSIFINTHNLNQMNPILEWGYYTDTIKKDNSITFKTTLNEMLNMIKTITTKNRFSAEYLDTLISIEPINENINEEIDEEITLEKIYDIKGKDLLIDRHALRKYFEDKGIIIEDMVINHFDFETGEPKGTFINNEPFLGDDNELSLKNISLLNEDEITAKDWILLEEHLKKIPFVEDVYISTQKNSALVNISNEVFAELK